MTEDIKEKLQDKAIEDAEYSEEVKEKKHARNKRRPKKKKGASMRMFIFWTFVIFLILVIAAVWIAVNLTYRQKAMNILSQRTNKQCSSLARDIEIPINPEDNHIENDIKQLAGFSQGRILVVDANYNVLLDSNKGEEGRIVISDKIMKVMSGEVSSLSEELDGYVISIYPIISDNTIVGAVLMTASTSEVESSFYSVFDGTVIIVGIILAIGIIVALIIARISVKDIDRINKQISRVSDGDFSYRMKIKGFKETKALAQNCNSVLEKLSSLDSSRQEFVSNVSHELKTPITSMKVLAESLIQNEEATAEEYREFMGDIVAEVDRESKIISDLLILVKTDQKKEKLEYSDTDINALLDVILKRVSPLAKQRNIEINYENYREVNAFVDEVKLSLVFSNLIENAIKYNVENGTVKVSLNADAKYFYVKVADTGVGIPDDCKDRVFDRFYRVDKARSRDTGGTGLGLAIAKSQVQAHGGTIKLYSESGKGTTFTVKIPVFHDSVIESMTQ